MRKIGLVFSVLATVVGCGGAMSAKSPPRESYAGAPAPESVAAEAPASGARAAVDDVAPSSVTESPATAAAPAAPPAPGPRPMAKAEAKPTSTAVAAEPPPPARPLPRAGQLTAGVWDDNLNFDFWRPYAAKMTSANPSDNAMFSELEMNGALSASKQTQAHTDLDVQLVLDTTGSMGDELRYLQSEFDTIAAQLRSRFPNVTPRWSLVVYRDHGDKYVTRDFDFTTDTNGFRTNLRAQSAGGGGDTPEAVVEGLTHGLSQSWRVQDANVARIAFWVADAPAHPGEGRVLANVVRQAKAKGVHVYPIASSDTDEAAEYQMRSAAQMTGGRYMFLTDDSGVGNAHAEPHIPCYNVTRLDSAIVRMISVELSGKYVEAEPQALVRQVGRPDREGKCKLASGLLVASY